jgi:hypothetical protein
MLSRWSLLIEFEQALQYADAAVPADAYLFVPPDDDCRESEWSPGKESRLLQLR